MTDEEVPLKGGRVTTGVVRIGETVRRPLGPHSPFVHRLLRHLADQHPAARLAPPLGSPERAQLYKWLFFLSSTVQPAYMQFRYPEQHVSFEAGVGAGHPDAADAVAADAVAAVRTAAAERAARAFEPLAGSAAKMSRPP